MCIHVLNATHLELFQLPRLKKHFEVGNILEKQRYRNIKAPPPTQLLPASPMHLCTHNYFEPTQTPFQFRTYIAK